MITVFAGAWLYAQPGQQTNSKQPAATEAWNRGNDSNRWYRTDAASTAGAAHFFDRREQI
jgi:hypothetical protein